MSSAISYIMTELGPCIGKCRNLSRCFFVKDYFARRHLMCYTLAVKFKRCIRCGEERLTWPMRNDNDVAEEKIYGSVIICNEPDDERADFEMTCLKYLASVVYNNS